ncbi:ANTAR domain-containing response regulator [Mangrovimicrobium sediminis]|uniref:ANTAR domain-containing response regulator n=1 Tax=Mangrovimicrobium sediminis TaxID=2562682 RepID=UPI001F103436|nr:ANTAR domain-containing protein [Haliea sp. SAOS-164]
MPNSPANKVLRVILVDDDLSRATAVEARLREVGFEVLSVIPTASGLLFQMAQQEPDVVIIALDSPDRDVLESLAIASTHNPRPVVMFSEAGDQGFITDAIRAGVTAYQAEDINPTRVRAAIDIAVAQFSAFNNLREELDETRRQLEERKLVEKAKGLLMSLHKVEEEEAFATLRKLAMDKNRTLGETAREVISILERSKPKGRQR